jgi:RND superfamily putative drug exporter
MTAVRDTPAEASRGAATRPRRRRWLLPALVILFFLVASAPLGRLAGDLSTVERNDSAAYLPKGAEATGVLEASKRFVGVETTTAIIVYSKASRITRDDQAQMILATGKLADYFDTRLAGPPRGPVVSDDGQAAQVVYPLVGSDPEQLRGDVDLLRVAGPVPGLEMHVAGPAAALTDLTEVFGQVDGLLLLVTGAAVLLILILVYRGPILPLLVLFIAGIALGLASGAVYLLAKADVLTLSGDGRGILSVLVLGAATDYALLLVARFREELRRHQDRYDAMLAAWRAATPPILASAGTVVFGLLCLLASNLGSTRGLGPVAAIGIACAAVSMLVLLPAILVLLGRVAFWPFRPSFAGPSAPTAAEASVTVPAERDGAAGTPPIAARGVWSLVTRAVDRRPRLVWAVTALALCGLALGITRLQAEGVPRTESFRAQVDSTTGQAVLARHFPEAAGTPAVIVAKAERLDEVLGAARGVRGVTEVDAYVNPLDRLDRPAGAPDPPPMVVDGLARLDATLAMPADSPRAAQVIRELRRAVQAIPAAEARVGGYTAGNLDVQDTAQRDRLVVIPLILAVSFVILVLLLRAVVAPLVLIGTVVLSFLATMGVSGVVFRDVLGYAGADSSFPLFAFVFLVAFGIDYNIFLMTRVREEVAVRGHRAGTLTGLAVTGGVITSAGVVLAATFGVLAVLPLVFLAELAFAVAFGVLLDTLVVRSLLVPALTVDLGPASWWPSRLGRRRLGAGDLHERVHGMASNSSLR